MNYRDFPNILFNRSLSIKLIKLPTVSVGWWFNMPGFPFNRQFSSSVYKKWMVEVPWKITLL